MAAGLQSGCQTRNPSIHSMSIDESGEYWKGSEPRDIERFLAVYTSSEEAYPATAFHAIQCDCGSERFRLVRASSMTQVSCLQCGRVRYICRDGDPIHWEEATEENIPEPYRCIECESKEANVCLGFAGYPESPEADAIKWFYVGVRCSNCGILGCFNGWKVGRGPMNIAMFRQIAGDSGKQT